MPHLLPTVAESQIKGMVNQMMQLRCYLKAKLRLMPKAKPKKAARSESTDSKGDKSKKHIRWQVPFH